MIIQITLFIRSNQYTVHDHSLRMSCSGTGGKCQERVLCSGNNPGVIFSAGKRIINKCLLLFIGVDAEMVAESIGISAESSIHLIDIDRFRRADIHIRMFFPYFLIHIGFECREHRLVQAGVRKGSY